VHGKLKRHLSQVHMVGTIGMSSEIKCREARTLIPHLILVLFYAHVCVY
jgi:hypothetical protein